MRTFNRQLADQDASRPANSTRPMRGATNRNVAGVRAVDEHTVEFTLIQPDVTFLSRLTDIPCRIVSAAALDKYGPEVGQHLVGAGPFKLVSAVPQQAVTLEAYSDYFGGSPLIDRLVLQQVTDPSSLNAGLQSGQITASSFVAHSSAKSLAANPKVTVYETPRLVAIFLLMNVTDPALSDIRVRQAVNLCVDRARIAQNAFFGYADEPKGYLLPSAEVGYDPTLADLSKYDVTAAKKLVAEAGAGRPGDRADRAEQQLVPEGGADPGGEPQGDRPGADGAAVRPWHVRGQGVRPEGAPDRVVGAQRLRARSGGPGQQHAVVGGQLRQPRHRSRHIGRGLVEELDTLLVAGLQTERQRRRKAAYTKAQRFFAENFMAISMVGHAQNIVVASAELGKINAPALSSQRMQLEKAGFKA